MNNFKEYLEIQEFIELIDENLINAAISGIGNVGSQIARGTGNILGGIYNTGTGTIQTGVGVLQSLGGGFKKGGSNVKSGLKKATGGLAQSLKGATQVAASPVSGAVRAVQANDEDFLTKTELDRTPFQKTFGLNTWDAKDKQNLRKHAELEAKKEELKSKEFAKHMIAYKSAKTKEEKENAVKNMKKAHPEKFEQLKREGEKRRIAKLKQIIDMANQKKARSKMKIADAV